MPSSSWNDSTASNYTTRTANQLDHKENRKKKGMHLFPSVFLCGKKMGEPINIII